MPVIDLKELAIKLQNIFSRINLNTIDPEEIDATETHSIQDGLVPTSR